MSTRPKSKKSGKPQTKHKASAVKKLVLSPQKKDGGMKRVQPTTTNPDIKVKKASYSKSLRLDVLGSASARTRLIEMGGENTINVIRDFDRDMSDEEIARKTGIKASDVRVVLNRMHSHGLFSYTRVRDKDSGWYSYIWKMSEGRLKQFAGEREDEGGESTVDNGGDKYHCTSCNDGQLVEFENAMNTQFRCGRCGNGLVFFEKRRK